MSNQGSRQQPGDESLFRWRKDSTTGETSDLVTDADVLYRAAEILFQARPRLAEDLNRLASRLESEPSTDGDKP